MAIPPAPSPQDHAEHTTAIALMRQRSEENTRRIEALEKASIDSRAEINQLSTAMAAHQTMDVSARRWEERVENWMEGQEEAMRKVQEALASITGQTRGASRIVEVIVMLLMLAASVWSAISAHQQTSAAFEALKNAVHK